MLLDELQVITGHIDDVNIDYDAEQHTVTVRGRDKTADLVDSSGPSTSFVGLTLAQFAERLLEPFKISLKVETDVGRAFRGEQAELGDPVFETLERAARYRGVLLMSDGFGNLVITRPSRERLNTELRLGANVLKARGQFSLRRRFQTYTVVGQDKGGDFRSGLEVSEVSSPPIEDTEVRRYRPRILVAEEMVDI